MSMNKEAEAFGTTTPPPTQVPSQAPPPNYSYPAQGAAPLQPQFTGGIQPQFVQNAQFTPMAPISQLPNMQNGTIGSNHSTMTRAQPAPVLGTQQQVNMGTIPVQAGMGVPLQPGLGSPQYPQQTVNGAFAAAGMATNAGVQGVPVGQFGQTVNPGVGQQQYVPYPVLVQPQPPAGPTAAQIGEQYMAQQYAMCAMGNHDRRKKFGVVGIVCAIIFFPIGLLCMFADQEESCVRCGKRL